MTFGDNDQRSNSEVQREITKQKQRKHGHLKTIEVGSGTMEE